MRRRTLFVPGTGLAVLALLAAVTVWGGGGGPARACPPGYQPAQGQAEGSHDGGMCVSRRHPETLHELEGRDDSTARALAPFATLKPGAYANAVAQRDAMVAAGTRLPGSTGTWTALGTTPLLADEPGYDEINGSGLVQVAGRIQDFAIVPGTQRLYAAVANGGIWRSDDLGATWTSAGDGLPTQVLGSVGFTPAGGPSGTIMALTGDGSFGRYAVAGVGLFRSRDEGRTWQRSAGIPDGALGFKVAVDPTNATVVYAATSFGLFRSDDAGESFTDVLLPTGPCAGHSDAKGCFFANVVTDVVVQAADKFGHRGGRVLAAVGWRESDKKNADGSIQAPANGMYRSDSGRPGTFARITDASPLNPSHDAAPGLPERHRLGRMEMGEAQGADQNHDYVYTLVQDAVKFEKGLPAIDVPEGVKSPLPNPDVFNGVYVSSDFGSTWRLMATAEELKSPVSGSSLTGALATSYGPGIQSWYNQFIRPDPTRQTKAGVPTRLAFGLEEVWENQVQDLPLNGLTVFKVIGRYFGGDSCLGLSLRFPVCPTNLGQLTPSTTTHPDQHGALWVPDGKGGVTLVVGNDGGVYRQSAAAGQDLTNTRWGAGDNVGMHTLLPYHAVMAKDGTVWAGLQDNGEMKIEPGGRQIATFGGDGFFSAVDPDNSAVAYEETTEGSMNVTADSGHHWKDISPGLTSAAFSTQFKMDPHDPKHLIIAGRDVKETTAGPETQSAAGSSLVAAPRKDAGAKATAAAAPKQWTKVFDLGVRTHPGDAAAKSSDDDPDNRMSAIALDGDNSYVGFCGFCDTVGEGVPFGRGLATNVGGSKPPKRLSGDGWHIAAARGLPSRIITSIAIDPTNPRTIYLSLAGYERRWAPPGVVGDDVSKVGTGHVFRSTDAGESFTDISGNLPDIPVNWVALRNGQLLVATDIGAFISADVNGSSYAPLGTGLPTVQVRTIELAPGDPNMLVAATFGRGVYTYCFPAAPEAARTPHPGSRRLRPLGRSPSPPARRSRRSGR